MKDNFSTQSDNYANYRPTYPQDFFAYLYAMVPNKQQAWDCGTGNGQVAIELAKTFEKVFATDIGASQIKYAARADNIMYPVQPAEKTNFADRQFDLIIIAQAIHWFHFDKFYAEAKRTAREKSLICVPGYGRIAVSEVIDATIGDFYRNVTGAYSHKARRYIDEDYATIPFPFTEIKTPRLVNKLQWTLPHLVGYLNTCSAVKHFIKQKKYNPVDALQKELEQHWGTEQTKEVQFPLLLRLGTIF